MRALANDREITATLGVPVRRVEAAAWFGSGLICGAAGLLLPDLLTSLDYSALTFLVISAARRGADRAAALALDDALRRDRGRPGAGGRTEPVRVDLRSYRSSAPFVLAIVALLFMSRRASSRSRGPQLSS